jgi:hypothetical protein
MLKRGGFIPDKSHPRSLRLGIKRSETTSLPNAQQKFSQLILKEYGAREV